MELILCFDIGGTEIKYSLYDRSGTVYQEYPSIPTLGGSESVLERVETIISKLLKCEKIDGLAFSSAGVIDSDKGKVLYAGYTMPRYSGTQIKTDIKNKFHMICEVENDVNCACLAEAKFGAGKGYDSIICLTIGTGIGGSIFLNGKLFSGAAYTAGEVGYTSVNGQYFQDIASTTFLVKRANEIVRNRQFVNGREVFSEAKSGSQGCIMAIEEMVDNLTNGLVNIIYLFNPESIILGGGIMSQKEYLAPIINKRIEQKLIAPIFNQTQIRFAEQGNKAGMLGALIHFNELHPTF